MLDPGRVLLLLLFCLLQDLRDAAAQELEPQRGRARALTAPLERTKTSGAMKVRKLLEGIRKTFSCLPEQMPDCAEQGC